MRLFKQHYDIHKDEGLSEGEIVEELMDTFCLGQSQIYDYIRAMKFIERISERSEFISEPLETQLHPSACVIIDSAPLDEQDKLLIEAIEKRLTVRDLRERVEKLKEPQIIQEEREEGVSIDTLEDDEEWVPPPIAVSMETVEPLGVEPEIARRGISADSPLDRSKAVSESGRRELRPKEAPTFHDPADLTLKLTHEQTIQEYLEDLFGRYPAITDGDEYQVDKLAKTFGIKYRGEEAPSGPVAP